MITLAHIGLSPEQVGRAAAKAIRKGSCGRRGLPAPVVSAMWADYQRLGSCAKVAKLYDRSRESINVILKNHGYKLNAKNFKPVREYNGRKYTPGKNGYWRDTIYRGANPELEAQLHRRIWVDAFGPIPAGHQVSFRDGDKNNCRLENLFCLPTAEVTLYHYRRLYPDRANLTAEQRREWWKAFYRRYAAGKAAEFVKKGLRSDGKPRRRGVPHVPGELRYFPPGRLNPDFCKINGIPFKNVSNARVVSETATQRVIRYRAWESLPIDQAYRELRAEMDSEKPQDIYK